MSYPASEVSAHSSFRVHGFGNGAVLRRAIVTASRLLEPLKVPVQGPSGRESPSPYFWKATLTLISQEGISDLDRVFPDLEDRDPLLIGIASASRPVLHALGSQTPDLWCVPVEERDSVANVAGEWKSEGCGAVAAFHPSGICAWSSHNAAFGKSQGFLQREVSGEHAAACGNVIGGLAFALIEELLGDNLFNKTSVRVERECLEMRPLHLGSAVEAGLAAATLMAENNVTGERYVKGEALGKMRRLLRAWRGPEPQAWGAKGR